MQITTIYHTDSQCWDSKYSDYLLRVALRKISDPEEARDLVQDTFLSGLERQAQFRGTSTERTWLTSILLHKIIDLYRKGALENRKQPHVIKTITDQMISFSAEDKLRQKEFALYFDSVLRKLPGLGAEVFKMKYMDELPTDEICAHLGITPANFWTITHRSKLRLRSCLQQAG